MQSIASAYFEFQRIPQDLITGVVVTLIGLCLLFTVKPRLSIDEQVKPPSSPDGTDYRFSVINRGLVTVIEVKAKLFTVDYSNGSRTYIELEFDEREACTCTLHSRLRCVMTLHASGRVPSGLPRHGQRAA